MKTIMVCWECNADGSESKAIASKTFGDREEARIWMHGKHERYGAQGLDAYLSHAGCLCLTAPPKRPGKMWIFEITPEGTKAGPRLTGLDEPCHRCGGTGQYDGGVYRGICYRCEGKGYQTDGDRTRNHWYDVFRERRAMATVQGRR